MFVVAPFSSRVTPAAPESPDRTELPPPAGARHPVRTTAGEPVQAPGRPHFSQIRRNHSAAPASGLAHFHRLRRRRSEERRVGKESRSKRTPTQPQSTE